MIGCLENRLRLNRLPLEAETEEVVETQQWRRDKASFAGAGGRRALAYLYLPKRGVRPFQVIHYLPSDESSTG